MTYFSLTRFRVGQQDLNMRTAGREDREVECKRGGKKDRTKKG
jgi:hypothetical protein